MRDDPMLTEDEVLGSLAEAALVTDESVRVTGSNPTFVARYRFDPRGLVMDEVLTRVAAHPTGDVDPTPAEPGLPGSAEPGAFTRRTWAVSTGEGTAAVVEIVSGPLRRGGRIAGRLWIWHDVTARARAEATLARRVRAAELLASTAASLLRAPGPLEVAEQLCRRVMDLIDCQVFFNYVLDEIAGRLRLNAFAGISDAEADRILWQDYGIGVCGCASGECCSLVTERIRATTDPEAARLRSFGVRAYACNPLLAADGRVLGMLSFGTRTKDAFDADDFHLMRSVASQVSEAIIRWHSDAVIAQKHEELRTIFDASPTAIFFKDMENRFQRVNRACADMMGVSAGALEGQSLFDLVPRDQAETFWHHDLEVIRTGRPRTDMVEALLARDGERWVRTDKVPYRTPRGDIVGVIGFSVDVTEHRRIEAQHTRLVEELRRSNQELADFASAVSHDLKAPLRSIGMLADWLIRDQTDRLDETGREHLALLRRSVRRMNLLIDGILEYSRLGRTEARPCAIGVGDVVKHALELLGLPASAGVVVEPDLPVVNVDPLRLSRVLQNLIGNAAKHVPATGGEIRVGCRRVDGTRRCFVADNGPGIDPRHHERIFQLFQTLSPVDDGEGTGMGLALVKRIVEGWRGRVWVDSDLGRGATFWFTLPDQDDGAGEERAALEPG